MHRIFLTLLLALPAFGRPLAENHCTSTFRQITDNRAPNWDAFQILFGAAEPTPIGLTQERDNLDYIGLLGKPEAQKLFFLHGNLKTLKELNDKLFEGQGKKDVDAARNLFRILFWENLEAHPVLSKAVVAQYLDFKSMELAIDPAKTGYPPERLQAEVDHVLRTTQIHFDAAMRHLMLENKPLMEKMLQESGLTSDFRAWHLFGSATGNPDLAATAARTAAEVFRPEQGPRLKAMPFNEAIMRAKVARAERVEKRILLSQLGEDSSLFTEYESTGIKVLSPGAIDILRKVKATDKEEYIAYVTKKFREELDVVLDRDQAIHLRDYFDVVDRFSPSIRVAKRGRVELEKAIHGALNVDFAGQNVTNLYHTMGALAQATSGADAIARARTGEKLATSRLELLRQVFDEARNRAKIDGEFQYSGDDGSVILTRVPGEAAQIRFYQELATDKRAPLSDFRIVWVPPIRGKLGIDGGAISKESVMGENFEKRIRAKLHRELKGKDVGLALEMDPVGQTVKVFVIGASPELTATIQRVSADPALLPEGYRLRAAVPVARTP